ncbi:MAG: hypothetical protein ABI610_02020, partial [Acidobacteriota bacterium]
MRRVWLALLIAVCASAPPLPADAVSDVLKADLARERRRMATDSSQLADVARRLETAAGGLASASRAVADVAGRSDTAAEEVGRREDAVAAAEQEVRTLLDRRRLLVDRILERRRSIALLDAELRGKGRPSAVDLLTGRWSLTMEPGEQRGVFRLALDGSLVSGDYTFEGGMSGSLRGTLIGDRLRLERVDSQLGFVAIFHGRLARDGSALSGTWESTTFGVGAAGAGRWRAVPIRDEEREESP